MSKSYLTNSQMWTSFWISVHEAPHEIVEIQSGVENLSFRNFLYIYPWVGGRTFGYVSKMKIPAAPSHYYDLATAVTEKCVEIAEKKGCSFLQFDLNDVQGIDFLEQELLSRLRKKGISLKASRKSLQYHHTIVKDCHDLQPQQGLDNKSLQLFFDINNRWFLQTSTKLRRYTRKALQSDLRVRIGKSELLNDFFRLLKDTSKRQAFATHATEYYTKLAEVGKSHIIIVYDGDKPVSAWFGIFDEDTMYYLYGGNTPEGMRKRSSYLAQLAALSLISQLGLSYYDLGGYDKDKGYGLFKEMFHGDIITFPGDWTIPLKKDYPFINNLLKIRDLFKS